ncbi:MAG: FAD-dependent oxidoreductase [Myxococcota bacterium]
MGALGTAERPVRVAVVGAGPAGFFVSEALLKRAAPVFSVDLIERLPTPFGLVRAGVAPDHQKIKSVTRTFEKTAQHGRFRFFGHVTVGKDVSHEELLSHYDQVVYAIGSSGDRRLGIPGEELTGCHAATAFVGWYNGHPDFRDFPFDLGKKRAVVVGAGNVALDISRVLLRDRDELAKTDIADYALDALRRSPLEEVVVLARRGPAQAAFTTGELEDIIALPGVAVRVDPKQLEVDETTLARLDANAKRNLEVLQKVADAPKAEARRTLKLEFLASPVEVLGEDGKVRGVKVERNALVPVGDDVKARGTGEFFELDAGLVFRSIGYFGQPVPGVPFDEKAGVIPNVDGRVKERDGATVPRVYAVGWIRRGPLGVIGTNKADGVLVAERVAEDVAALVPEARPSPGGLPRLLAERGVKVVSYADWLALDRLEVEAGRQTGKVREKITRIEDMLNALLREG